MTQDEPAWRIAALSRLANARTKGHRRLGHRKSKGGCKTCKQRRLKCDETFPECNRCTKVGRRCEGYTPSPSSSAGSLETSVILCPPSPYSSLDEIDRRPLEYFLELVAPTLGGSFGGDFWGRSVLQLCHSEAYVKDSILAISVLYEHPQYTKSLRGRDRFFDPDGEVPTHTNDDERRLLPPLLSTRHAQALHFYNRAIKRIRHRLVEGTADPALVLLSCILFSCIDVMRDHIFGALQTFTQAAEIIRQHDSATAKPLTSTHIDLMRPIVHRMSNLAATYGFIQPALLTTSQTHNDSFSTITEARDMLFQITADINLFIWQVSQRGASHDFDPDFPSTSKKEKDQITFNIPYFPKPLHNRGIPWLRPHPSVLNHQQHLTRRLQTWHDAFTTLPPHASTPALHLYHTTSSLLLSTHLSPNEQIYDTPTSLSLFHSILQHAKDYITTNKLQRATFTFDQGVIGPLSVVALKCRVHGLRRKALELIDMAPRKEGMWGAAGVGQLCARVMNVEAEGSGLGRVDFRGQCDGLVDDAVIPGMERRARYVELLKNEGGEFEVRVTRHDSRAEVYAICD